MSEKIYKLSADLSDGWSLSIMENSSLFLVRSVGGQIFHVQLGYCDPLIKDEEFDLQSAINWVRSGGLTEDSFH